MGQPLQAFETLSRRLHVLGIQSGEPGTIAQAIAGADIALWDLAARLAGQPLWRCWVARRQPARAGLRVGHQSDPPRGTRSRMRAEGFRAFKLKVGFGAERDVANLAALRALLGAETPLMVDANQAWTPPEAVAMSRAAGGIQPRLAGRTDRRRLVDGRMAGAGEGHRHTARRRREPARPAMFAEAIASGALRSSSPTWANGAASPAACRWRAKRLFHGRMFCPHWLGGGIGLIASIQLKAAAGGAGYVEVDSNPNPLRSLLATPMPAFRDGAFVLGEQAGLGVEPDGDVVREYLRPHG